MSEMPKLVIVPEGLRAAINARLDAAFAGLPEDERAIAENDREFLYHQLLEAFDQYGVIPEFALERRDPAS